MTSVILAEFGTGQVLWSLIWIFLFVVWFWLLITVFSDLFRDHEMSGWGKAAWIIGVIILPFLGVLLYFIVRGRGMAERAAEQQAQAKAEFDDYVRQQAGAGSAADQIEKAKSLHDSGAISDEEYEALKKKALA